jgi:hypothetical protein
MDVPSKCTIARTMGRLASAPEVLGRRNRDPNPKKNEKLYSVSVKLQSFVKMSIKLNPCP